MTAEALLRAIGTALREAQIPFMLTGSIAAAYHGAGRATMDVDFVIDPDLGRLEHFVASIEKSGRYVSMLDALGIRDQWTAVTSLSE